MAEDSEKRFLTSNTKVQIPFPNSLFLSRLEKWYSEARRRDRQSQFCYAKAIESLKKYPLPFSCGKEATILKNIGPGIANKLEKEWVKYLTEHPETNPQCHSIANILMTEQNKEKESGTESSHVKSIKVSGRSNSYIPAFKSVGYGVVLSLHRGISKNMAGMKRSEITIDVKRICNIENPNIYSVIVNLEKRNLIEVIPGRIPKYRLTNEGIALAEKLKEASASLNSCGQKINLEVTFSGIYNFDIVLYIDHIEVTNCPLLLNHIQGKLSFEVKKLNIGDFLWIARDKDKGKEVVLDILIERKQVNDLASSILDGRFREQKYRISNCRILRPTYLVEGDPAACTIMPESTLNQAISNTMVRDKFKVIRTKSLIDTASALVSIDKYLKKKYENVSISLSKNKGNIPFEIFNEESKKTKLLCNKEIFIAMLMQIRGASFEKSLSIATHFGTVSGLMKKYEELAWDSKDCIKLVSDVVHRNSKIGDSLATALYNYFLP